MEKSVNNPHEKKLKTIENWMTAIGIVFIVLLVTSGFVGLFSKSLSYSQAFLIVFGGFYLIFIPGFIISYSIYPEKSQNFERHHSRRKGSIDLYERIIISFIISVLLIPIIAYYIEFLGFDPVPFNIAITDLGIIILSLIFMFYKFYKW